MQITVEKVVWIALVLVVVAVVGLFLMGQVLTGAQQVGQRFYMRLINSQYSDATQSYVISFRIVNTGEAGATLTSISINPVGFGSGASVTPVSPSSLTGLNIPPKGTMDITVQVSGGYVTGSKSLVITATFQDPNGNTYSAAQSLEIP